MTVNEFRERTLDHLEAWYYDLRLLLKSDRKAQKIEPQQKRMLIATAQSLLHDIQDALQCELDGSDK